MHVLVPGNSKWLMTVKGFIGALIVSMTYVTRIVYVATCIETTLAARNLEAKVYSRSGIEDAAMWTSKRFQMLYLKERRVGDCLRDGYLERKMFPTPVGSCPRTKWGIVGRVRRKRANQDDDLFGCDDEKVPTAWVHGLFLACAPVDQFERKYW
ncbi:hypothetical protein OSB04_031524 [Centaurea solstitialis]|uniref:Uncharacterized protein n=1 Tax=Centaurea solstitialis TaxID=347529 RepID=A0AA38W870_9ASTR|nr:hypothetical protein OSB04_031524 [Centaurea solstitialis]